MNKKKKQERNFVIDYCIGIFSAFLLIIGNMFGFWFIGVVFYKTMNFIAALLLTIMGLNVIISIAMLLGFIRHKDSEAKAKGYEGYNW